MVKVILFLFVVFAVEDGKETIKRQWVMPSVEECIVKASEYLIVDPPEKGSILVGCKVEDLGGTK